MSGKPKILVVEDEAVFVMSLEVLLRKQYDILPSASTGEEAIRTARENHPDLVIVDVGLAGEMDGIETVEGIRAICDPKIVFITGYSDESIRRRAAHLSPEAYLVKPVNIAELKMAIKESLGSVTG